MGFYWSYTLLLKSPVLMHSCIHKMQSDGLPHYVDYCTSDKDITKPSMQV